MKCVCVQGEDCFRGDKADSRHRWSFFFCESETFLLQRVLKTRLMNQVGLSRQELDYVTLTLLGRLCNKGTEINIYEWSTAAFRALIGSYSAKTRQSWWKNWLTRVSSVWRQRRARHGEIPPESKERIYLFLHRSSVECNNSLCNLLFPVTHYFKGKGSLLATFWLVTLVTMIVATLPHTLGLQLTLARQRTQLRHQPCTAVAVNYSARLCLTLVCATK